MESGQTREEWKGFAETNKILQTKKPIPVDGVCVRVGAMRCHSQGLTIKLDRDIPLDELSEIIEKSNPPEEHLKKIDYKQVRDFL